MFDWLQLGVLNGVALPQPWMWAAIAITVSVVVPYLLGSINSAVLISRVFYGADIRTQGSGNGGLTNMHRVYGGTAALLVLLGDVLKVALSLLIVGIFFGLRYGMLTDAVTGEAITGNGFANTFAAQPLLYVAGTVAILGHIFPIYFNFKGGTGVLCTAAAVLILAPAVFAVEILIFDIMLFGFKYVSLSSLAVAFFYPLLTDRLFRLFFGVSPSLLILLSCIFIGLFIFYTHRTNIRRLLDHCENKVSFKKKDKSEKK